MFDVVVKVCELIDAPFLDAYNLADISISFAIGLVR